MRTWLLQGNPARWRIFDFLADGQLLRSWTVKRYISDPAEGDRVVLWLTGSAGGVVGLGRVTGPVEAADPDELDPYWTDAAPAAGGHRLPIAMDEYFLDNPIPRNVLAADADFSSASILRSPQSSNPFPLTESEWAAIERNLEREFQQETAWDLAPGEPIRRVELHERFGGSHQSGISPCKQSPNVLIFTDPTSGNQFGYFDEWVGDDVFVYTGEGQVGDQTMTGGNRAILNHLTNGQALRVFEGARGVVRYVGEFMVDLENPFAMVTAPQRDIHELRQVIHFRLLRLAEEARASLQIELATGTNYRSADEFGDFAIPSGQRSQNPDAYGRGCRAHRRLQNGLAALVEAGGLTPWSPAVQDPDFDLAWSTAEDHLVVVEVKSLTRTNEVRQLRVGLGQVLDYQDTLLARVATVTPVLFVQRRPADPRWIAIADRCGVVLAWPDGPASLPGVGPAEETRGESFESQGG